MFSVLNDVQSRCRISNMIIAHVFLHNFAELMQDVRAIRPPELLRRQLETKEGLCRLILGKKKKNPHPQN